MVPMRLSDAQKRKLTSLLKALPFDAASKLLVEVERQRLSGAHGLPHAEMIDALRGPAISGRPLPPRTPTPLRLFCGPFEDFLVSGPRAEKTMGRIARETLTPFWAWLTETVMPEDAARLGDRLVRAVLDGDAEARRVTLADLHRSATAALGVALDAVDRSRAERDAALDRLGGEAALEDVREIAAMVEFAAEFAQVQSDFPRPVGRLDDEQVEVVRRHYQAFSDHMPHLTPYLFILIMNRMNRPWEMVGVVGRITNAQDDRLISATSDMGVIGERLLREAEAIAAGFAQTRNEERPARGTLNDLRRFVDLVQGFIRELGVRRDGPWGRRIYDARRLASEAMERRLELALKAIRGALPFRPAGAGGAGALAPRPDLAAADKEAVTRAVNGARLIVGAGEFAQQAAFAAVHSDVRERAAREALDYADALLDEIRASGEQAPAVLTEGVAQLLALLENDAHADSFRRRASAAVAA